VRRPVNALKKMFILLTTQLLLLTFLVTAPATPSYGDKSTTWKLIQSFGETMNYQEARGRLYLLIFFVTVLILAAAGLFWSLIKNNSSSNEAAGLEPDPDLQAPDSSQKRSWFRLALKKDLLFQMKNAGEFNRGQIVNLSGGGIQFSTVRKLAPNDLIRVSFELGPDKKFNLDGRVVRVAAASDGQGKDCFLTGVQFINLTSTEQDRIANSILQEQHKLMLGRRTKKEEACPVCGRPLPRKETGETAPCIYCLMK